ncbi:hypothetical protein AAFF_G00290470 [Aldrovandia affinis]|uniref:Uncharacterized protein n=1 Tax=Aldrovandia affinis TaxID=143900 RepID=A0AAD7W1D9_9TELE|nr:hypothetical protein AAFF_G00290470 [Aldrovandia affinis]
MAGQLLQANLGICADGAGLVGGCLCEGQTQSRLVNTILRGFAQGSALMPTPPPPSPCPSASPVPSCLLPQIAVYAAAPALRGSAGFKLCQRSRCWEKRRD